MAKQKPSIFDLVNEGIIKVGYTFFASKDDFGYMGVVTDKEHIRIQYTKEGLDPKNMGLQLYMSFGKPANEICGYPVNAWFFWKYHKNNEDRPINDWRKEYLELTTL
jgi:hypothetical protein